MQDVPVERATATLTLPRIVSLVPSITELLFDLGLGPQLVGRTGFCVHPREALRSIAKVGGTKDVDLARVRALAPTHVIVNVDENTLPVVQALREFVPDVVVTHPLTVQDNAALYRLIGDRFDRGEQAQALARRLGDEIDATQRAAFAPLRVLYLIWADPWMTVSADTYISSMLAAVGLSTVLSDAAVRYPVVDLDRDLARAGSIDALLLPSEPFRFEQAHVAALRERPVLRGCPVLRVDGEMTSWYGSRAIAGLAYLRGFRGELDAAVRAAGQEAVR